MNKAERTAAGKRVAAVRAKKLGWKAPFSELPKATQVAFKSTGDIRISKRSERKRFGDTSGKQTYGHFSGRPPTGLSKRDLVERAVIRSHQPPA